MITILNPGHGGVAEGYYLTPGKCSPDKLKNGKYFYEGEFNRSICNFIQQFNIWERRNLKLLTLVPGPIRVSLRNRIDYINRLHKKEPCILIEIHSNASGNKWDSIKGFAVFIAENASQTSKRIAKLIHTDLEFDLKGFIEPRYEYYVSKNVSSTLSRTKCPAVLVECGFHNNKEEVEILAKPVNQMRIARSIWETIKEFN